MHTTARVASNLHQGTAWSLHRGVMHQSQTVASKPVVGPGCTPVVLSHSSSSGQVWLLEEEHWCVYCTRGRSVVVLVVVGCSKGVGRAQWVGITERGTDHNQGVWGGESTALTGTIVTAALYLASS